MTMSATASTPSDVGRLVMMTNGEYTSSSVFSKPGLATVMGLVKQTDGNYGMTDVPRLQFGSEAPTRTSYGVLSAVSALQLCV